MDIQREPRRHSSVLKRLTWPALAFATLLLTLAAWGLSTRAPAVDADEIWTGQVVRGELVREVAGVGTLVATELRAVTNRSEGVVERIRVLPGDIVDAEDILLDMSSPQLGEELAAARWDLASAEAEEVLLAVDADNRELDLIAQHAGAQSEYTAASLELEARESLRAAQVFSEIELQRTRLGVERLKSRLDAENARLERSSEYRDAQRQSAAARLSRQRDLVQRLEERVEHLSVRAGVGGVVQEVNTMEGERLLAGQAVARIVNPDRLIARVRVSEREASRVHPGLPAILTVGSQAFGGSVVRVDPTVRDRSVNVDIEVTSTPEDTALRPELSVSARIELGRLDDALTLPRPMGLSGGQESISLFRIVGTSSRAERIEVSVGDASERLVEVRSGLREGDRVILTDLPDFRDHAFIRIR